MRVCTRKQALKSFLNEAQWSRMDSFLTLPLSSVSEVLASIASLVVAYILFEINFKFAVHTFSTCSYP